MTADVIDFATRRQAAALQKAVAKNGGAAATASGAPCDSEDSGIHSVSRDQANRQLDERLAFIEDYIGKLEKNGMDVTKYRQVLADEQPMIAEFRQLIPPASSPYSPRRSDSIATLTTAQWETTVQLMTNLKALAEGVAHALNQTLRIKQTELAINRMRNIVKARLLRQADWDDPDLGLCTAIEIAANPHLYIEQADRMLADAKVAINEERWGDAYRLIDEASTVPAYLQATANALVAGALEEIPA